MELEGQVAMVTGSGQGIGKAIASRFAQEGADIAVVDLNRDAAMGAADAIRGLGRRALVEVADVSDSEAVAGILSGVVREFGKLDVLVNNAGIEKRAPFLDITPADWQRQIDVNLSGTFYCTQAAAREMSVHGYGRIVNLSSVAGLIGPIDLAAYGASKAGIVGLTRAAALDLADYGIHRQRHRSWTDRNRADAGRLERGGSPGTAPTWSNSALRNRRGDRPHCPFPRVA